jgi:hypothetical protein
MRAADAGSTQVVQTPLQTSNDEGRSRWRYRRHREDAQHLADTGCP